MSGSATAVHTLWGTPHSLYTGKIRSYLIKKGVPFRELYPPHPRFRSEIRPVTRLKVAPVIVTADGHILQDTTDMIDYFESACPQPLMIPETPVQRVVAWLIGAFGSEALLPAAMSYRWSYRQEQENFLRAEFGRGVHTGPNRNARLAAGLQLMNYFNDFLPRLGVTEQTRPVIEATYLELLDALDVHFQHYPYILGGRPSIADCGLMASLYAHLARDPVPATLMKNKAPNVYRWTERMNLATIVDGEFPDCPDTYLPRDAIPATLEPLLRLIFRDWGPEILANAHCYNNWISANPDLASGDLVAENGARTVHPTLGPIEYGLRGCVIRRASSPHTLWHFDRAASHAMGLVGRPATTLSALLRRTGGQWMMKVALARPMQRRDYVLVVS
jgi:glutathione S-transferase